MDRKAPPATDSPDRLLDAAITRHQAGDMQGAMDLYRRVLALKPAQIDANHLLGLALWQSGVQEEGLARVAEAAARAPKSAPIQNNLGGMLMARRQFRRAETAFRAALAAKPEHVDALSNLAAVLLELNRPADAEKAARQALALAPIRADAWANRGVALLELGRLAEAETCQRKALDLNPDLAVAHANLGTLRRRQGFLLESIPLFTRALELDPDQPVARFNLSLDHLAQGRLGQGWEMYADRFRARQRQAVRDLDVPFWQGEMLAGRHLLIWPEQGLGDEILFASIYPDLAGLDGPVSVECDSRLVGLFARSFPHLRVAASGAIATADVQIAAGSLPGLARASLSRFNGRPWLRADEGAVAAWQGRLAAAGPALNVGFCWRSGLKSAERAGLYAALSDWAPLFALSGIRWVPLQYDLADPATQAEMQAALPSGVELYESGLDLRDDLDGVASLISALDMVMSADTAVSEMAGALGVPTWRIGSNDDWTRLGTHVRPWFASMRCFARLRGQLFADLLRCVARALSALCPPTRPTEPVDLPPLPADTLQRAADLHKAGKRADAMAMYAAVLARQPDDAVALHLLGHAHAQEGRPAEGAPLMERAVALRPDYVAALTNLGTALRDLGRPADAVERYRQAARLRPESIHIPVNIALCQKELGDLDGAEATLAALMVRAGDVATAWDVLGLVRLQQGDTDGAIAAHRTATRVDPHLLSAWVNLGTALRNAHRFADAVAVLETAEALDPERVEVQANLGYALFRSGRLADAEGALSRALNLVPDYAPALIDLARIRDQQLRPAESLALLDRLLAVQPGNMLARWNRANVHLILGNLPQGWTDYGARFQAGGEMKARMLPMPLWRGQDIRGKRLLLWREQGLGDELLFAGLIGDVLRLGADIVVECDERLVGLLTRSFPGITARGCTSDPKDADFHSAMGDLPGLLRPDLRTFAGTGPWLRPDPARVAAMWARLNQLPPGLRVGFCWRSVKQDGDRPLAYLRLPDLLPLLALPGIVPINLQYDGGRAEIEQAEHDHGLILHRFDEIDQKHDLESAAALISCLDLVITAGTAVGELAGSLGVPVWRFQPCPDWSELGTQIRPWFASMRLFTAIPVVQTVPLMVRELRRLMALSVAQASPPAPVADLPTIMALHQSGQLHDAEVGYRAILTIRPEDGDARHLLAQVLWQTGRLAEALAAVDRVLADDPAFAAAHNTRGGILRSAGQPVMAERAFRQALAHRPHYPEAWTNLGAALVELRRYADAEKAHRRALAQRAEYPRAQVNLGVALRLLGRCAEAAIWHEKALAVAPTMADGWSDLGLCRAALGDMEGGRHCQDRALAVDPTYAEAAVNRSLMLVRCGDIVGARASIQQALAIRPGFAKARYNGSLLALGQGDLAAGWHDHEARFDSGEVYRGHPPDLPEWDGCALAGRHLLVWREQGLGDELMFASLYRRLAGLGGPVTIWADARLVPILARALPLAQVVAEGTPMKADCQVAAGSLPRLLSSYLAGWDGSAFLSPRDDLRTLWRDRLAALPPGLRVGLCWRSQLRTADRAASYTALSDWLPLLRVSGVQVVSLQYDGAVDEIVEMEATQDVRLHRWDGVDLRDDLETALALTVGLDLVISVATAVGEMAGSLGVPVWRLSGPLDWTRLGTAVRPWFASMAVLTAPRVADLVPEVVRRLMALQPAPGPDGDPATWLERGIALQRGGDPAGAMPFYHGVIARLGEQPVALHLLGLALHQTGRGGEGVVFMERALAASPDYTAAWVNLGNLRQTLDQPAAAEMAYRQALSLQPRDAGTWTNLGNALRAQRRFADAAKAHTRAIGFDPTSPVPHANLAVVWKEMDDLPKAEAEYRLALDLGGDAVSLQAGLGDVLRQRGQMPMARTALDHALRLNPMDADAWNNHGRLEEDCGDHVAARRDFDRALSIAPDLATARYNRGLLDLAEGNLAKGWDGYAARFRGTETIRGRQVNLPAWDGGDIVGKRLLVWGEQGLGDQLMFAALYPALAARCGQLVIEGDARLAGLFTRAFPTSLVRATTSDPRDADLAVAAGNVARFLWRDLGHMVPTPYLSALPDRVSGWSDRLSALGPGLKVGICWRSALMTTSRQRAYARLPDLTPLAAVPDVTLVSLQRQATAAEWDGAGFAVTRFDDLDLTDDLEGQAALISALDLVITVPTAVGEMAGALGVPVWRLGRADWTGLGTQVRPWFPSMRRIDTTGGMAVAIANAARLLVSARRS